MRADDFWENAKPSKQSAESKPRWMTSTTPGSTRCAVASRPAPFPVVPSVLAHLQPDHQQPRLAGCHHGGQRPAQRGRLEPRPLCARHSHPSVRPLPLPALRKAGINFTRSRRSLLDSSPVRSPWCGRRLCSTTSTRRRSAERTPRLATISMAMASLISVPRQGGRRCVRARSAQRVDPVRCLHPDRRLRDPCLDHGSGVRLLQAPKSMRSLVMSMFLFTSAIAAALQQAFIALSSDPTWCGTTPCLASWPSLASSVSCGPSGSSTRRRTRSTSSTPARCTPSRPPSRLTTRRPKKRIPQPCTLSLSRCCVLLHCSYLSAWDLPQWNQIYLPIYFVCVCVCVCVELCNACRRSRLGVR